MKGLNGRPVCLHPHDIVLFHSQLSLHIKSQLPQRQNVTVNLLNLRHIDWVEPGGDVKCMVIAACLRPLCHLRTIKVAYVC